MFSDVLLQAITIDNISMNIYVSQENIGLENQHGDACA